MFVHFSKFNCKYMTALDALDPGSENFLDAGKVKPLLDLLNTEMVCRVGVSVYHCTSVLAMILHSPGQENNLGQTSFRLLQHFQSHTLKNVFSEHRCNMLHRRKAHLIKLECENDLEIHSEKNGKRYC